MQALKSPHGAFLKAKANRVFAIVLVVQLVCMGFLVPAAGAQEEAPLPAGEPHFNVELIVFSYRAADSAGNERSEEHTSELQSRENLVCRLLLEKKKKRNRHQENIKP